MNRPSSRAPEPPGPRTSAPYAAAGASRRTDTSKRPLGPSPDTTPPGVAFKPSADPPPAAKTGTDKPMPRASSPNRRPGAGRPAGGFAPPAAAPKGPPPLPASAKKPLSPPRQGPPAADDHDDDEAPTAIFVHSVKYTYDPNGPPGAAGPPDDRGGGEPPNAVESATRPTAEHEHPGSTRQHLARVVPAAGVPAVAQEQPSAPSAAWSFPTGGQFPPTGQQHGPMQQPVAATTMQQVVTLPSGRISPVPPDFMHDTQHHRIVPAHATSPANLAAGLGTVPRSPSPHADLDAAPLWLKAIAVSTVVSALTVLGVLFWMIQQRF